MITVWLDKRFITTFSVSEVVKELRSRGLDTHEPYSHWESPQKHYSQGFRGTALPDKVVGVVRTVIGVIPITKSWEG